MSTREAISGQLKGFFEAEAERYHVDMAFLYGSWARGVPKAESDVDVAVVLRPEPPGEQEAFDLVTEVSLRLCQALGRDVDVTPIYWDFRKPMLYYNAVALGAPLYVRDFDRCVSLKMAAISQMEDFSIFGVPWQRELARRKLEGIAHGRFRYARGRVTESVEFIAEEMREFADDYLDREWQEYQGDRKLQKLMDRTVENILTALIEVSGAVLTEEEIAAESYSDVLGKIGGLFGYSEEEQDRVGKLALQRNRLAHRYLNFRWQAIRMYVRERELIRRVLESMLAREEGADDDHPS